MEEDFDIKAWRERMGYSQSEAARALDTAFPSYRNWDQGKARVPTSVRLLCRILEQQRAA